MAGVLTSAKFTLQSGAEYEFNINTGGIVAITTNALQHGAAILSFPMYGSNVGYLIAGAEAYVAGDVTTTNKIAFWRSEDGKCHIRNNYSSSFVFYYNILSQKS